MFWGKGDTSKLEEPEKDTLSHLRRLEETGHILTLSATKAEVAIRAVDWWDNWESVVKLMSSLKNISLLVGALLAIYWATSGWVVSFIARVAAKAGGL